MSSLFQTFLMEPVETIFFGRPRSFSAGEAHRADSMFPPSPITFQGVIRSQLLRAVTPPLDLDDWSQAAKREREDLVGGPDSLPPGWQIQGPFPARTLDGKTEPWVRVPRFLLGDRVKTPRRAEPIRSSHPGLDDLGSTEFLGCPGEGFCDPLRGWIGPENLRFALTGQGAWNGEQCRHDLPPFVKRERQPGVAIAKTGTALSGHLYFLESLRFGQRSGLMGAIRANFNNRVSADAFNGTAGTVGRKGRLVVFEKVADFHPSWDYVMQGNHLPRELRGGETFWLVLLTPARIENAQDPALNPASPSGVHLTILTALTDKPETFGGYRMATGESRDNQLYVPAGSAWRFKLEGGSESARLDYLRLLNNAHTLGPKDEAGFGFGHTVVGIGPKEKKQ